MTKNILRSDVVHHTTNMMKAWLKRTLPQIAKKEGVTFSWVSSASRLLDDEPHHPSSRSCQKSMRKDIQSIIIKSFSYIMIRANGILLICTYLALAACGQVNYSAHQLPEGLEGEKPNIDQSYRIEISENRKALTLDYMKRHYSEQLYASQSARDGMEAISIDPKVIVIHYTVLTPLKKLIAYFSKETIEQGRKQIAANGALNVGIQFVVDRDGSIYQLYPQTIMARHTIGLNHTAIGIENIGNGDLGESDKSHPLTHAQLESNAKLVRYLVGKYPTIKTMIGHSEYQLLEDEAHPDHHLFYEKFPNYRTDKIDPGDTFMKALRKNLQGVESNKN